jgi:hypothetical protein
MGILCEVIVKAGAGRFPPYHLRRPDVGYPETFRRELPLCAPSWRLLLGLFRGLGFCFGPGLLPSCGYSLPALLAEFFFAELRGSSPAALGRPQFRQRLRVDVLFDCHAADSTGSGTYCQAGKSVDSKEHKVHLNYLDRRANRRIMCLKICTRARMTTRSQIKTRRTSAGTPMRR